MHFSNGRAHLQAGNTAVFDAMLTALADAGLNALAVAVENAAKAFSTPGGVSGLTTGLRDIDAKMGGENFQIANS